MCQNSGNLWYHTHAQWGLATATCLLGDHDRAAALAAAALSTMHDLGDPIGTALCLDTLAWTAAGRRDTLRALTLLGAVDSAWAANQVVPTKTLREQHAAALEAARAMVPDSVYRAATAKGAAMSPAEALAFALGGPPEPASAPADHGENQPRLTRREQEVAVLVARGMSNGQIAAALVISARTAETHVQHIMDKLGFSTRAQIAAWAAARAAAP